MRPRIASRVQALGFVLIYAIGLVAGRAHALGAAHGRHHHEGAAPACAAGPRVAADCGDGAPCQDPTHDHGPFREHRHEQCPICQPVFLAGIGPAVAPALPPMARLRAEPLRHEIGQRGRDAASGHAIRAPPGTL